MEVTQKNATRRIIYVITKSNFGGAQRYVYDLVTAAAAEGHTVLVAAGGEGELIRRLGEAGITVHPIEALVRDINIDAEFAAFFELLKLFREKKPDVVHLNSSKAGLAALAARLAGVRHIVFTMHGWAWNEDRPLWQRALIALAYWITILLCHRVIAVSNMTREQGKFLPFVQGKFRVVHNGVHAIPFLTREEARKKLLPDSKCTLWIGTIAELHPVKGLPVLIEAFEHFAPDYPDSELVIIGDGQDRAQLERQIEIEGVSGHSHLAGHVIDASTLLSAFDVFVLPSRSEALAYVLLEAGSASLPVVATNVGGIPEVIIDRKTGILVPYGDREALTNALESLARDVELRKQLGNALHEKVREEFSLEKMTHDTFALYEKNS